LRFLFLSKTANAIDDCDERNPAAQTHPADDHWFARPTCLCTSKLI